MGRVVEFEVFHPALEKALAYGDGAKGGRPPYDPVSMFKVLILAAQNTVSDARMEFLIRDRLSWLRFLGFDLGAVTPDENTIRLFREELARAGAIDALFAAFDGQLRERGYLPMGGHRLPQPIQRGLAEVDRPGQPRPPQEAQRQIDAGAHRTCQRRQIHRPCLHQACVRQAEGSDRTVRPHRRHRARQGEDHTRQSRLQYRPPDVPRTAPRHGIAASDKGAFRQDQPETPPSGRQRRARHSRHPAITVRQHVDVGDHLDQVKRLKELEAENTRLRRAVSDLTLEKLVLKEAASGNF